MRLDVLLLLFVAVIGLALWCLFIFSIIGYVFVLLYGPVNPFPGTFVDNLNPALFSYLNKF
jgi:hypothetical protein